MLCRICIRHFGKGQYHIYTLKRGIYKLTILEVFCVVETSSPALISERNCTYLKKTQYSAKCLHLSLMEQKFRIFYKEELCFSRVYVRACQELVGCGNLRG
jgi:hypothetical protein